LTLPVPVIASAIEDRDVTTVGKLKGVGKRKADMIVSELHGKVGKYALMKETYRGVAQKTADFNNQVIDVLVQQLGHTKSEAQKLVIEALQRNPDVSTPEELFEEVYRGSRGQ
jgi:Holliday junction DNA helicase RuvA